MSNLLKTRGYDQSYGELGVSASVFISGSRALVVKQGLLAPADATNSGVAFGGISLDSFDNLAGASDSKKIRFVKAPAEVSVAVSGAAAALVYGVDVYSNATANLVVSGSSVGVKVGKLQEADEERTGFYWVSLEK